jgi:glycerophosphoryl diester phosphodiesterase
MKDFIVYAHRGASEYCPENTLLSFYTGVYMRANGIETDVQRTKDGVLVLFHDDTINRMMGKEGSISDYTLDELKTFPMEKMGRVDYITTLEDFLEKFSRFDLTFAIELKMGGCEEDTAKLIAKYCNPEKTIVTSFKYEYLLEYKKYAPDAKIGYLVSGGKLSDDLTERLINDGFYEICPKASDITAELCEEYHRRGLNVRTWGISNEELMRKVYDIGCDGTTVNFPDKLIEYIGK